MITGTEWMFLALIVTVGDLLALYIGYRIAKPRLKRTLTGYIPVVAKSVQASVGRSIEQATEGLDLGAIAGQLGGGSGGLEGLGAIQGLLGGGGGGIGDLLSLLGQFGGGSKQTFKKPDHRPGK